MSTYLHLTIGPVQGFIAQARRTSDFWAGSRILSWLAGAALLSIRHRVPDAEVVVPRISNLDDVDELRDYVSNPDVGLPNRVLARERKRGFDPGLARQVADDVRRAWVAAAQAIWERDLAGLAYEHLDYTKEVWDRQIGSYFEIAWVLGGEIADVEKALAGRKRLRLHTRATEPGGKCTLIGGLQELSAADTIVARELGLGMPPDRRQPRSAADLIEAVGRRKALRLSFWNAVRSIRGGASEFKQGEVLSAIAFVKRRWHHGDVNVVAGKGLPMLPQVRAPRRPRSTSDIAVRPWLQHAVVQADADALGRLADVVAEVSSRVPRPPRAPRRRSDAVRALLRADGAVFYAGGLEYDLDEKQVRQVDRAIESLRLSQSPSRYYAVLRMDADKRGGDQNPGKLFIAFAREAPTIVGRHSGQAVFSAGDELVAFLPRQTALECCVALRELFVKLGREHELTGMTISAAIVYAHVKAPLMRVLSYAEETLSSVAKEATGRDALAVMVVKRSGTRAAYSAPWDWVLKGDPDAANGQDRLSWARDAMVGATPRVSSSFVYRLEQRLGELDQVMALASLEPPKLAREIALADYSRSDHSAGRSQEECADLVTGLLELCLRVVRRDLVSSGRIGHELHALPGHSIGGLMVARFLADERAV